MKFLVANGTDAILAALQAEVEGLWVGNDPLERPANRWTHAEAIKALVHGTALSSSCCCCVFLPAGAGVVFSFACGVDGGVGAVAASFDARFAHGRPR